MLDYLKIVKNRWIILKKAFDNPANTGISTVGTGHDTLFFARLRISHICAQNIVFYPILATTIAIDVCSGRIGALFSLAHSAAVFFLKA